MERLCDLQAELTSALEEQVNDVDILKVNMLSHPTKNPFSLMYMGCV